MKYKCTRDQRYDEGTWEIKKTPKTELATKLSHSEDNPVGVFSFYEIGTKKKIGTNTGNPKRDHEDGTFTVYFAQAGIPYYFEPIHEN